MTRFLLALLVAELGALLAAILSAAVRPPPPVADPPAETLRRLEIRLRADLDKTHPAVGGERYRQFECREVLRRKER